MPAQECIFCRFSKEKKVKIWENDFFYAMFDSFPVSPGHALIIPKRHVIEIKDLNKKEWKSLKETIKEVIKLIEKTDLKAIYEAMLRNPLSDISIWFCKRALSHPRINIKPDAYNHGVNDGKAAGRTVDHLHWHIIPRYKGDMADPRGGVRYVIPEMGNYKVPRR